VQEFQLSTSFQKFANVSKNRLLTRTARNRAATVKGAVAAEYETAFMKRCTKLAARTAQDHLRKYGSDQSAREQSEISGSQESSKQTCK